MLRFALVLVFLSLWSASIACEQRPPQKPVEPQNETTSEYQKSETPDTSEASTTVETQSVEKTVDAEPAPTKEPTPELPDNREPMTPADGTPNEIPNDTPDVGPHDNTQDRPEGCSVDGCGNDRSTPSDSTPSDSTPSDSTPSDTIACQNDTMCKATETCVSGTCAKKRCGPNEALTPQGTCVCKVDFVSCGGNCVASCRADQTLDTSLCTCDCRTGFVEAKGQCVAKAPYTSPAKDLWPSEADKVLTKCTAQTMQWWSGSKSRDITFVAFGDPQAADPAAGCPKDNEYTPLQLTKMREALNGVDLTTHKWPSGASFHREGKVYRRVRGVIIAGDLTQNGSDAGPAGTQLGHDCREYTLYRNAFGRCGNENKVKFPLYEGYGNHDFPFVQGKGDPSYHPVVGYLDRITAAHRPGAAKDLYDDPTPGTAHYAWRWDDIWFVQLNLKVGSQKEVIAKGGNTRNPLPKGSLAFLSNFLQTRSNSKTRQIVLVTHYGMHSSRIEKAEKTAFCKLIQSAQLGTSPFSAQKLAPKNPVIANIHGHTHSEPKSLMWTCLAPYNAISIPRFDVGTPFYKASKNGPGKLHFTIFRMGTKYLEAVGVSVDATTPTGAYTYTYKQRLGTLLAP